MNLTSQLILLKKLKTEANRELSKAREWIIKNGENSKQIFYIDNAHATFLEPYRTVYDKYAAINECLETALALGYKEMVDVILDEPFPAIVYFEAPTETDLTSRLKKRFKE